MAPEDTEYTEIYLLMSQGNKSPRGFADRKSSFTFAFTTQEKAKAFMKEARRAGMMADLDTLYRMTVGEYFQWQKEGKTNADLSIDNEPGILRHPFFLHNAHVQN